MPHSLRAKLSGLRYKGILEDKDYKRLCHALDLEKVEQEPTDEWQNGYDMAWEEAKVFYEQEPKTGEWEEIVKEHKCFARDGTYTTTEYHCSECGAEPSADEDGYYEFSNYCPNCGAKMRKESE